MNIFFVSLGCDKNLVDSEMMITSLRKDGFTITDREEDAEIIVVNTCCFIGDAKEESINTLLEMASYKEDGKCRLLVAAGCLAQRYHEEIRTEIPEVDVIIGTMGYEEMGTTLRDALKEKGVVESIRSIDYLPTPLTDRDNTSGGSYAYLKIAEGCDNHCAYCVIPSLRGKYRSRPLEELLDEAAELASAGVKELIVIAQDITRYGTDLNGEHQLAKLLKELCKLDFHWIRLHYLYPTDTTDELIDVIADEPKIVKYLDIPLQHVSKRILRAMHRPGDGAEFTRLIENMRERIPGLVLRTSLIVGLPGETEDEFAELCEFLQNVGIERVGVFEYSPEEGTEAAELPDQIDDETKQNRRLIVEELQSGVLDDYNTSRHGEVMQVLVEGFDDEQQLWYGRTYADSVEVDGHVYFDAMDTEPGEGEFVSVLITESLGPDLLGVRQKEA